MLSTIVAQWVALGILFLLASAFSERTAKYGFVIIPLVAGLFSFFGWLPSTYLKIIIPLLIAMGVVTFLKEQFRVKLGGYGASGDLIWKLMVFMMLLQVSMVFVGGLGVSSDGDMFNSDSKMGGLAGDKSKTDAAYDINKIENDAAPFAKAENGSTWDQLYAGFTMVMSAWSLLWAMLIGVLSMYWTLTNVFSIPPLIAGVLSSIMYIMFVIELYVLVAKPFSKPDT